MKPNPLWTIYLVTNLLNGKQYIGLTRQKPKMRWRAHRRCNQTNSVLHRAIKKHGELNFLFEEYLSCWKHEDACYIEKLLIAELNTKCPNGYNITDGGDGTTGYKKPRYLVEIHRQQMRNFYKNNPDRRETISRQHKGKTISPEMKQRLREVMLEIGSRITEAGRKKISELKRGQIIPQETRDKIAATLRGRKPSEETRAKLSAAKKGRKFTPEHRAAMSAARQNPETQRKWKEANKGRTLSAAHKAAITSANHKRWEATRVSEKNDGQAPRDAELQIQLSLPLSP